MDLLASHESGWVPSTVPPPLSVETTCEATSSTQMCTSSLTEVQSIPLPPTSSVTPPPLPEINFAEPTLPPVTVPSLLDCLRKTPPPPPPTHTEEELAERVMASGKPECWSPALTVVLRALRPPGTDPNKRIRRRLTDRHGRQTRITLPTGQSIPSNP